MRILLALFLLSTASGLFAAPVSVTCGSPVQSITTDTGLTSANCTLSTGSFSGPQAAAKAQVVLSLAGNGANWSALTTEQSGVAVQGLPSPGQASGPGTEVHARINYSDLLITAGPIRPGYLQLQFSGSVGYIYDGSGAITTGIISTNPNSPLPQFTCEEYGGCTGNAFLQHNLLIPFTLGKAFTIEANGYFDSYAYYNDGISGGSATSNYQFRFLEANGSTPVEVSQAPEPSTCLLLAAPFCAGLIYKKRAYLRCLGKL